MNWHIYWAVMTVLALCLGAVLHSWVVAANIVNSKLNGIMGYREYLRKFLPVIMFRFVLSWAVFLVYAENATAVCTLVSEHFTSLEWLAKHPIHASPTIALIYGLFVDSFLASIIALAGKYFPAFKVDIPPPPGQMEAEKP